ncbi:MAG: hypothetical protein ABEJ70_04610 [Halobacteriaceae archaeon]
MAHTDSPAPLAPPDAAGSPVDGVPPDVVYDLLGNRRRRLVLYHLLSAPDHATDVGALATQVAAWEHGVRPEAVTTAQRRTVYNTLRQLHLPRLASAGVVDDRTVRLRSDSDQLDALLTQLPAGRLVSVRRLRTAGVALWAAVWALVVAGWVGVGPARSLDPAVGAGLLAVVGLVVALAVLTQRRGGP